MAKIEFVSKYLTTLDLVVASVKNSKLEFPSKN